MYEITAALEVMNNKVLQSKGLFLTTGGKYCAYLILVKTKEYEKLKKESQETENFKSEQG